ncbi:Ig-like domain-containing protein [Deinococcus sp.]|uniref:Ig-like domain-containing protein n=1 Tax=Deinococcus sp. TaxID=47478 RepID=UPI0025C0FC95|nr:Ig-like domain-containing protein [Deinococcus sp.]
MKKTLRLTLPIVLLSAILSACSSGNQTDTINPTVSLSTISGTVTQPGTVTLQATASDNKSVKEVDFYVDNVLVQAVTTPTNGVYQTPYTWQARQNGAHIVKAVAVDSSNNRSTDATQQVNVNIVVDTVKPVVTISVPSTITTAGTYNVTVTASDNVGVVALTGTLTLPNGMSVPLSNLSTSGGTVALPVTAAYNGTSTLTVTATDAAGNQTTQTQQVVVNIP